MSIPIILLMILKHCNGAIALVSQKDEIQAVSKAIHEVVDVFYTQRNIRFDIFSFHRDFETNFDDNFDKMPEAPPQDFQLLSKFLSMSTKFSYRLSLNQTTYVNERFYAMTKSIIFFINSCSDYLQIHYEFVLFNKYFRPFKFLIIIENCSLQRQSSDKFGTLKYDKFNNLQPYGLTPEIFILMSTKFNFKPSFQAAKLQNKVSAFDIYDNFVLIDINGTIKLPVICFEVIRFTDNIIGGQSTVDFLEVREIILVTPGELYLPFEKLLLPFDDWTWQLIVGTFLGAFLAIFVINRLPKFFQTTIYGENVTTPVLNVFSSFFGISQVKLPEKNFPRFILTMFVLFCLIFRTCYQSKLFEFMTSEPRRPPPKTIEDLIDRNYTMYEPLHFATNVALKASEKWPKVEVVNIKKYTNIFETQSQNTSAKIALSMQSIVLYHYDWATRDPKFWLQIPDTSVQVSHVGFSTFRNHFFLNGLNDVTQRLLMTGIMDKIVCDLLGTKKKFLRLSEPKTLTLENLGFGFIIWMCFCGICLLVFLCEISVGNFRKLMSFCEVWDGIVRCVREVKNRIFKFRICQ